MDEKAYPIALRSSTKAPRAMVALPMAPHRHISRGGSMLASWIAFFTVGFERIKINAVSIRGFTEHDVVPLAQYCRERGFELRMAAAEKELADMETRGHRFFEDTLRIGRVVDLLNRARMQKEFEEKVVADAPIRVERRVTEMIDWLVDQDFRQWQAVTSKLLARQRQHASRAVRLLAHSRDTARLADGQCTRRRDSPCSYSRTL